MEERPILFSPQMVNAILDGKKTMTRRIIKSKTGLFEINSANYEHDAAHYYHCRTVTLLDDNEKGIGTLFCPYGRIGDILWVRETYRIINHSGTGSKFFYKADACQQDLKDKTIKWKPSIFMPKYASRIRLRITDIKVERLRDIYEGDAYKEGVRPLQNQSAIGTFYELWQQINGDGSWEENPWVWVISFETLKTPKP